MRNPKTIVSECDLLSGPPERAHDWMKNRYLLQNNMVPVVSGDAQLELSLAQCTHPYIELSVAQYGLFAEAVRMVFERKTSPNHKVLRIACLLNEHIVDASGRHSPYPLIDSAVSAQDFVQNLTDDELAALFANPRMDISLQEDFLSRGWSWDALTAERRRVAIKAIAMGKRLTNENPVSVLQREPGQDMRLCDPAWALSLWLPTTPEWASVYADLVDGMKMETVTLGISTTAYERWVPERDSEADRYETEIFETKAELGPYGRIRCALHSLLVALRVNHFTDLFESEDPAARAAGYGLSGMKVKQMKDAYEKDGVFALNYFIRNSFVWANEECKNMLETLVWQATEDDMGMSLLHVHEFNNRFHHHH